MNDTNMPTVEDIERKQKLLSLLFRVFVAILILIACVFAGWLISFIGYADDMIGAFDLPIKRIFPSTFHS